MKPSEISPGRADAAGGGSVADSPCLTGLRKRADFLRAARARHQAMAGMVVQARRRAPGDDGIRVGFTCSKKVGNAVARNRAKRRLRAVARAVLPKMGHAGWDYVLIGRADRTNTRDFGDLADDLSRALQLLHRERR